MFLHELPDGLWLPALGKPYTILKSVKGSVILQNEPDQVQKDLVCIVDNHTYESARYISDQGALNEWRKNKNNKTWMIVPGVTKISNKRF
jgi:hypothetical protein